MLGLLIKHEPYFEIRNRSRTLGQIPAVFFQSSESTGAPNTSGAFDVSNHLAPEHIPNGLKSVILHRSFQCHMAMATCGCESETSESESESSEAGSYSQFLYRIFKKNIRWAVIIFFLFL